MSDPITYDMNGTGSTLGGTFSAFLQVSTCGAEALLVGGKVVPGLGSGAEVEVEGTFS